MDCIIWNNLCDAVKSNIHLPEIPFEKSVANDFLNALDWNKLKGNLKEQYVINQHTKWRADFALFVSGNEDPEIMVELKKPSNKQKNKDRAQVSDYLKITNCRFGLYFGEKLELFFLRYKGEFSEIVSVLTVHYDKESPYYNILLGLLHSSTYNREALIKFCNEQLAIKDASQFWMKQENSPILVKFMMEHCKLNPELYERFRASIDIQVKEPAVSSSKNKHKAKIKKPSGNKLKLSKPRFQFWMAGLKKGDTIEFIPTGKRVTIISENRIEYLGKSYSLSGFCRAYIPEDMKHDENSYEGPMYFSYKGKTLKELRNENEDSWNEPM